MAPRGRRDWFSTLGWPERAFLFFLPLAVAADMASLPAMVSFSAGLAATFFGIWTILRFFRRGLRKAIWSLRNRLIVAYLFIAAVPILLLLLLTEASAYVVSGQIGAYLLNNELDRRVNNLRGTALSLAARPPAMRGEATRQSGAFLRERYPGFETLVAGKDGKTARFPEDSELEPPPAGHGDTAGIIVRGGRFYLWAHALGQNAESVVVVPLTRSFLRGLVPQLGDVNLTVFGGDAGGGAAHLHPPVAGEQPAPATEGATLVPPAANMADILVRWGVATPVADWDKPQNTRLAALAVLTRISGVMNLLFSLNTTSRTPTVLLALFAGMAVFLFLQVVSVYIGVRVTRSITSAVHELYEGTVRIREGDLEHRIRVDGEDQLAELSRSFNTMSENLARLLVAEKERQRLQAELEIAREVQAQLHPKPIEGIGSLRISSVCNAARMVSGDYYDYQSLNDSRLVMAIGDVAGKGISAALLMATLQSAMRSQLRQCMEAAVEPGDGAGHAVSTARLVSNLNQQLYASTSPEKYATFFFAVYDEQSSTLAYTNAGHLSPVLIRGGEAIALDTNGMVVGAFPFSRYGESSIRLEPGDLLVCFTDGVTEPENAYGEMFGEARLIDLLKEHSDKDGTEIAAQVVAEVTRWTATSELQDDMTILLAKKV